MAIEDDRKFHNESAEILCSQEVERVASLEVFRPNQECIMCGNKPGAVRYVRPPTFQLHDSDDFTADTYGTMLYECGYCSFKWQTQTLMGLVELDLVKRNLGN